jgi:hypothetical protein
METYLPAADKADIGAERIKINRYFWRRCIFRNFEGVVGAH